MGQKEEALNDYIQAVRFDGIVDYDFSNLYNNIAFEMMNKNVEKGK